MTAREKIVAGLRGVPTGTPTVAEVLAQLNANPQLRCVVCYARISFDGRVKDAHGIEDQHRNMWEQARNLGWLVVYRYTDNDKSASKENVVRDDYEQMLRDLTTGHTPEGYPVHGVMADNDDRLYRRPGDWERFLRAFTSQEGRVYHDSNGVQDLYAEGFEVKGLLGVAMSLAETRKKQRRSRANHRSRALRGKSVSAWRPFGWNDDKISLRTDEADAVRTAVRDVIAGASFGEITRRWNDAGFKTSRGNAFQHATVKPILTNPRLCGFRAIKGELVRGPDGIPVTGEWEAIITPKEWYAITATKLERGAAQGAGTARGGVVHKYLLTGILRCGNVLEDGTRCNHKLIGAKAHQWVKYEHAYTCKKTGNGGCNQNLKRGDETDKHITQLVLAKLRKDAHAAAQEIPEWGRADELERAITSRNTLEQRWHEGLEDDETFFRNLHPMEERIKKLRADQAQHAAKQASAEAAVADVAVAWESRTLSQKRALIKKALHAVIAIPGGKGNKPFNIDLLVPVWRSSE